MTSAKRRRLALPAHKGGTEHLLHLSGAEEFFAALAAFQIDKSRVGFLLPVFVFWKILYGSLALLTDILRMFFV